MGKKEPCSENDGTLTFDPPHIVVLMEKQMAVCTTPTKYLRIVVFVVSISSCSLQESSYSPHNVTLFITTHSTPLLLCLSCSECVFGRSCSNPSVHNVWHHGVFCFLTSILFLQCIWLWTVLFIWLDSLFFLIYLKNVLNSSFLWNQILTVMI